MLTNIHQNQDRQGHADAALKVRSAVCIFIHMLESKWPGGEGKKKLPHAGFRQQEVQANFKIGLHYTHKEKYQIFFSLIFHMSTQQDLKIWIRVQDNIKIIMSEGAVLHLM